MSTATPEQKLVYAALKTIQAVAETVREVGRAPAGAVFLALQTQGHTFASFRRIVDTLVRTGLVREEGHELVWVEPAEAAAAN